MASFRLAVDRGRTGEGRDRQADFIDCIVWERQAETVSQYCTKGKLVLVEGRLQMRRYEAQDGSKRTVYEVQANTVRFMPDGNRDGGQGQGPTRPASAPGSAPADPSGGWNNYNPDDDDAPF